MSQHRKSINPLFIWMFVLGLYKEDLQVFEICSFDKQILRLVVRLGIWFNHYSWIAVVTPTGHPKSVCDRCVIELLESP